MKNPAFFNPPQPGQPKKGLLVFLLHHLRPAHRSGAVVAGLDMAEETSGFAPDLSLMWGFPRIGVPQKWMVYFLWNILMKIDDDWGIRDYTAQ